MLTPKDLSFVLAILALQASIVQMWTSASNEMIFATKRPIVSTQKEVTLVAARRAFMEAEFSALEVNVQMNLAQQTRHV